MYVVVAAIQLACCGGSGSSRPQCCVGAVGGMLGAYKQDTLIDLEFASKFTTKPMKASSQPDRLSRHLGGNHWCTDDSSFFMKTCGIKARLA